MFHTPRSPGPAPTVRDTAEEPRGHVLREDPLARMRRERDEFAARHSLGPFG